MTIPLIPYGYCHCGCGRKTKIATRNDHTRGRVKGEPVRYLFNHHTRGNTVARESAGKRRPEAEFIVIDGEPCVRVPLTKGKWAIVSEASYPKVSDHVWLYSQAFACRVLATGLKERMHRTLLSVPQGKRVWHRNGDRLDNRDGNLVIGQRR